MGCICGKEQLNVSGRNFRILDTLGEGGFSFVYLAEEAGTHKKWALKCIECHSQMDQDSAREEIRIHEMLKPCPYVIDCEVSGIGKSRHGNAESEVYIVMPYYKRGTLFDELQLRNAQNNPISEDRILQLFENVCKGIQAFHSLKPLPYAHRDLKTANVLLSDGTHDEAVLMDLGSSRPARVTVNSQRDAQRLQDYAAEHCSMPYRAPELFHVETGAEISEKTDIWSAGCVLYALCFFKSPFDAVHERGDSVHLAVQSGKIDIPEDCGFSPELQTLIKSMLRIDPCERPSIDGVLQQVNSICTARKLLDTVTQPSKASGSDNHDIV